MSNYNILKNKLRKIKSFQILSLISLSFYSVCLYGLILMIQFLVDSLTNTKNVMNTESILFVLGLLLLLALSGFISQYFFNQLPIKAKNIFLSSLYKDVSRKEAKFIDDSNQGNIFSLLNNDACSFAQLVAVNPVILGYQFVTLVLCIVLMIFTQWVLAMLLICFVLLCFAFTSLLSKKLAQTSQQVFKEKETMTQKILEGLENHKTIIFLGKQGLFSDKFNNFLYKELQPVEKKVAFYQSEYMTIYILLTNILPFFSIILGIYFVSIGWMSIGQVLTIYALASQLQEPIRQIAEIRTNRLTAIQLAERLSLLIYKEESKTKELETVEAIEMKNVSFSYGQSPVIENLTFNIRKNENIFIKGDSGCGKSTLLDLLMKVQNVNDGEININGINIDDIKSESYYKYILMVEQEPVIFNDDLINNITMYDDYTSERIDEIISVCQLASFYKENIDKAIDKSNISGGQAQRISIARMLIRNPDILLLDEPTSALDETTSIAFSNSLNKYCEEHNISLVIVSHKKDIMSICERTLDIGWAEVDSCS